MTRARLIAAALCAAVLPITGVVATPAVAVELASDARSDVGSATLATPASGSRYVYVAKNGTDQVSPGPDDPDWATSYSREACLNTGATPGWASTKPPAERCPEPSASAPLFTIQAAIQVAKPGDVIVVRAGSYTEQLGWSARAGTRSSPIVMQAHPGERVDVLGDLILKNPDYWTIEGFHFGYRSGTTRGQAIVNIAGGTGWRFVSNEVYGSRGVANLMVVRNGSITANDYLIAGNCIRDNQGSDAHGLDHNIYLMPGVGSTGGVVERNIIAGAPRGSNIKASGSDAAGSPRHVEIRYNTLLSAASSVIVGLKAQDVHVYNNLITSPLGSDQYDGGIKTYALESPDTNSFTYNLIAGYADPIRETGDVRVYVPASGNVARTSNVAYTGSVANCTVAVTDRDLAVRYGHETDPDLAPSAPHVERLAGSDRFATAVTISQQFAPGVDRVYIATGLDYADALSAGPAAAHDGGPLLLTARDQLPASVRAEIVRLAPREVVLVGGTGAISSAVEAEIRKVQSNTQRIEGSDRYDTSRRLAAFAFKGETVSVAYVAHGGNFPDALAAGPAASAAGGPVVLVYGPANKVDAPTLALLDQLGVTTINIAGGTGVVTTAIERALRSEGFEVERLAGADRFTTAAQINEHQFGSSGRLTTVYLANGHGFADALAGSALAGVQGGPLYITEATCIPSAVGAAITTFDVDQVTLFGGTGVLGGGVVALVPCR